MSAKEELIAAALRLAALAERNTDDHNEWQHAIDSVREGCARAMVQPDMVEVERLIDAFGSSCDSVKKFGHIASFKPIGQQITERREARAALLAHIQRGAVPEWWQVVPSADQLWNNDEVMALNAELGLTMDQLSRLASAITRIAHPADWRERFSQAVYDDLAAADNQDFPLEEYPARILKVLDAVIGREIKPAPAEVPMPQGYVERPTDYTGDIWIESQMHTYGVACRAAGEAAGYAQLLKWAVSSWKSEVENRPLENKNRRPLDDVWRQVVRFAGGDPDALLGPSHDAALRGEVKP